MAAAAAEAKAQFSAIVPGATGFLDRSCAMWPAEGGEIPRERWHRFTPRGLLSQLIPPGQRLEGDTRIDAS